MNRTNTEYDICIVGGGMVGLTSAALLAETGLSIALLEADTPAKLSKQKDRPYALRVSAINLASMRIFEHLDIASEILANRASAYSRMQVWDADSNAGIQFDADDAGVDQLGYIIENELIINALHDFLKQYDNVVIHAGQALDSLQRDAGINHMGLKSMDLKHTRVNESSLSAALLIGADGQYSAVRQLAKMPVSRGRFDQTALVCRIQTAQPHQQTAYQCFHEHGPIAYLPLADGSSSIVWSCDTAIASRLQQLDDTAFARQVEQALQSRLGTVEILGPRAGFALAQQHAEYYVEPGLALIGDAAHRTHPLAGLGANLGLLDAATLSEVINGAISRQRHIHSRATLRQYERIRQPHNALMLDVMQGFKSGFASTAPGLRSLRALAMNSANRLVPAKALLSELATGNRGDLPVICQPAACRPATSRA